ncbi:putative Cyclophilin type peptidyl prolyl cis trans isomerase [Trypanosoma vivax]|nr:putative cyclophilin [Trypanosoma vivax]KAH8605937.1 putative Cyclophilin type peptidyl prolyl cis trans isomerase [Trypanosoma vivax]KAH8616913.1 putative Cyclophilin type peptidyl prolyl cis trans isomerase [Trypanosoma vivax]
MPVKRTPKVHKFHEGSSDDQLPVVSMFIDKGGTGAYGRIDIELFVNRVPKACDIFLQGCAFAATGDKRNVKRGSCKSYRFVRLTNEGLQVGERSGSRGASLVEFDSEIGRVNHGIGVVSLCRSVSSFDESFFFCITDNRSELDSLDKRHVAFGRVIEGLNELLSLRDALLSYVQEGCLIGDNPYTISELVLKSCK